MGTWAVDALGNDEAADWIAALRNEDDLSPIDRALDAVLDVGADYLEATPAAEALAAIEVLARIRGNGDSKSTNSKLVDEWIKRVTVRSSAQMLRKSSRALDRILDKKSELRELWDESDRTGEWTAYIEDLRRRATK